MSQEVLRIQIPWPCPDYEQTIQETLGVEPESPAGQRIVRLAHALQAPGSLRGFMQATDAFGAILPRLHPFSIDSEQTDEWQQALETLQGIQGLPEHIMHASHRGFCNSNPLYAVFLDREDFRAPGSVTDHLMACFFLSFVRNYRRLSPASRIRAGLALRSTLRGRGFPSVELFRLYCGGISTIPDFDQVAKSLKPGRDVRDKVLPTTVGYIRFLRLFLAGQIHRGTRWRSSRAGRPRYHLPDLPDTPYFPASPQFDPDKEDIQPDDPGRLISIRHVEETGQVAPSEGAALVDAAESSETISEFSRGISLEVASDRLRLRWRSEHLAHAIEANNRFLPTQWNQLNRFDLYVLTRELVHLSHSDSETIEGVPAPLLAGLLAAMFCRGTRLDTIMNMRQIRSAWDGALNHFRLFRKQAKWHGEWLIDGDLFNHFSRLSLEAQACVINPDKHCQVRLPMSEWCAEILARAQSARDAFLSASSDLGADVDGFFPLKTEIMKQAARTWLSMIRTAHPGCRATMKRIEQFLPQFSVQILDIDMAESAYMHGTLHPIYETQLYYTAIPTERIRDIYRRVWIRVEQEVAEECKAWKTPLHLGSSLRQMTIPHTEATSKFVGSRITPTDESVMRLRAFLETQLHQSQTILPRYKRTIEFHNHFVLYTVFLLAFCSGYRAIQDPFPDPNLIDPSTGCCLISDKDQKDRYCTRIVWLPDIAIKQIQFYKEHLDRLVIRMSLINNDAFQRLHNSLTGWEASPGQPLNHETMVPFLFRLTQHGQPKSLTPLWLRQMVNQAFPLPINANRHFLRTGLCQLGCPKDVIDAFMGHWHRGREPWGKHSSLSPVSFARMLEKYLRPMIHRSGWKPIKSFEA